MSLKGVIANLTDLTWSSDVDDILNDFYVPALSEAVSYDRLAGRFTSASFALTGRGILGLVKNGGSMRLVVEPKLTKDDIQAISEAMDTESEQYIETKMANEIDMLSEGAFRDHVRALGWMVVNGKLEIKVAIPRKWDSYLEKYGDGGIFHQKVGILRDIEGNTVTFSGSLNETVHGWLKNIEEFKVYCDWIPGSIPYLNSDIMNFDKFWSGESPAARVYDFPQAVADRLIKLAPSDIEELELEQWYKRIEKKREKRKPWPHQEKAVIKWIANECQGIFEMATGTGKTFAAILCVEHFFSKTKDALCVIACPTNVLVNQWKKDILGAFPGKPFLVANKDHPDWRNTLHQRILELELNKIGILFVFTTHETLANPDLIQIMSDLENDSMLVADEVHGLGSGKRRNGLISDSYKYRLGLSATPKRLMDEEGTEIIYNYFNEVVFEFSLLDAIHTINPTTGETYLTPYRYYPRFVGLTEDELVEYAEISRRLGRLHGTRNKEEFRQLQELLQIERAKIVKQAWNKYETVREILIEENDLSHCLIYCDEMSQLEIVQDICNDLGLVHHKLTNLEGEEEKLDILKHFSEGRIKVLPAIRCLDEGVDIPQAKVAIILASTTNSRQYIQRRGRVLRRFPGKEYSVIYDLLVNPSLASIDAEPYIRQLEERIFRKEIKRYLEFAGAAENQKECLDILRRQSG